MLVKAVANSTTASFIRVNGSEFVQKYLGEGPRMVRDVFRMARENSPAIIFIDEIDAIATKRFDAQTGADREVQRILLELLNQMDGFEQTSNVKVIMATNRADTLDPALLRPGRLDRKIEFPSLRDRRERRLIFTTIASKMSLSPEVDLDSLIVRNEPLSGAVIAAIMQEAGLRAVRKNRYNIIQSDLEDAYQAQVKSGQDDERYVVYELLMPCDANLSPPGWTFTGRLFVDVTLWFAHVIDWLSAAARYRKGRIRPLNRIPASASSPPGRHGGNLFHPICVLFDSVRLQS